MLNNDVPIPLYYQIKEIIKRKIADGEYGPDDLIPSERMLGEEYQVSRMTIRHALDDLVHEGFLRREQGVGTFVIGQKLTQQLGNLTSFTQVMKRQGKQAKSKVLKIQLEPASIEISQIFGIEKDRELVYLERLRFADDQAIAIEKCHILFEGCENIINDDLSASLYHLLINKYQIVPTRAMQEIEAGISTKREAEILDLPQLSSVLHMKRSTFDQNDKIFEYTESVYRGDRFTFRVELIV